MVVADTVMDHDLDTRDYQRLPPGTPTHPTRVLVADDEHLVVAGLVNNLRGLGYTIVGPAADGEEAVTLCRDLKPHIALLDIRMPKKDGITAAEVIFRQMQIPVIVLSAYSDPEYTSGASRVGVFGYLLKPASSDQLRVSLNVAWSRYLEHAGQASEVTALRTRLEDRKTIEQAKWVIVKRKGLSEPDAMKLLQRQARNNRRKLIEVAKSVMENESLFTDEAE